MKLILNLPQEGLDAKIKAFDIEGKVIQTAVARIEIEPIFYRADAVPAVLFGVVKGGKDDEDEAQRFMMSLSGTTGKCQLKNRSQPVKPVFDQPKDEAPPDDAEADDEETETEDDEDDLSLDELLDAEED